MSNYLSLLFKQKKVDEAHIECKIEAEQKFRSSATPLAEVDSYNECMDFHLAMVSNNPMNLKRLLELIFIFLLLFFLYSVVQNQGR